MADYQQIIQTLIDQGLLSPEETYNFQNDQLQQVFQDYFDFCMENLVNNQDAHGINPSHFYFENNYEGNASAYQKDGHKFIVVNMGAVDRIWSFYQNHIAFFDRPENEHYNHIAAAKNITVIELLFQYTTLYFYYHELGHLIQHNADEEAFLTRETLIANDDADDALLKHVYEFDADWFAANQLSFKLVNFYKNEDDQIDATIENLSGLITLGLSAIFNYFALISQHFEQIYYRERSHPHPIIRVSYVLTYIVNSFNPNLPENINLNFHEILSNAIAMSEQMLVNGMNNPALNFAGIFIQQGNNIEEYINAIIAEAAKHPELCYNKLPA